MAKARKTDRQEEKEGEEETRRSLSSEEGLLIPDHDGVGDCGHDHGGQGGLREGGRTPGMCRMWKENPRQVPLKGENLLLDKLNQQEEITIMFRNSVIAMVLHACCLICTSTI